MPVAETGFGFVPPPPVPPPVPPPDPPVEPPPPPVPPPPVPPPPVPPPDAFAKSGAAASDTNSPSAITAAPDPSAFIDQSSSRSLSIGSTGDSALSSAFALNASREKNNVEPSGEKIGQ